MNGTSPRAAGQGRPPTFRGLVRVLDRAERRVRRAARKVRLLRLEAAAATTRDDWFGAGVRLSWAIDTLSAARSEALEARAAVAGYLGFVSTHSIDRMEVAR